MADEPGEIRVKETESGVTHGFEQGDASGQLLEVSVLGISTAPGGKSATHASVVRVHLILDKESGRYRSQHGEIEAAVLKALNGVQGKLAEDRGDDGV